MSRPVLEIPRGLLFWSVLYQSESVDINQMKQLLSTQLPQALFWHTDLQPGPEYYAHEMGAAEGLKRLVAISLVPVEREVLIASKHQAFALEEATKRDKARVMNLDPGLLCLEQVLLSTYKPYAHRIYLAQGVFAELCLQYVGTSYKPLPWTYPDYRDSQMTDFFHFARSFLKREKTSWKKA
jgi:hypothetical protein